MRGMITLPAPTSMCSMSQARYNTYPQASLQGASSAAMGNARSSADEVAGGHFMGEPGKARAL
jgi:hypothetical protein